MGIAKDSRHLLIPLVKTERAWSYAMQLREAGAAEPRKRQHMMQRLAKAKKLSALTRAGSFEPILGECRVSRCRAREVLHDTRRPADGARS